jgi:hypothetical protein
MTANVEISEAMFARLKTAPVTPTMPPIAWPNKPFTPVVGSPYLRATMMPAEPLTIASFVQGENRYSGIMQVDVFVPDGDGTKRATTIADIVGNHFKRGLTVAAQTFSILIRRPPYMLSPYKDGAWWGIPVRVYYIADVANPP